MTRGTTRHTRELDVERTSRPAPAGQTPLARRSGLVIVYVLLRAPRASGSARARARCVRRCDVYVTGPGRSGLRFYTASSSVPLALGLAWVSVSALCAPSARASCGSRSRPGVHCPLCPRSDLPASTHQPPGTPRRERERVAPDCVCERRVDSQRLHDSAH